MIVEDDGTCRAHPHRADTGTGGKDLRLDHVPPGTNGSVDVTMGGGQPAWGKPGIDQSPNRAATSRTAFRRCQEVSEVLGHRRPQLRPSGFELHTALGGAETGLVQSSEGLDSGDGSAMTGARSSRPSAT